MAAGIVASVAPRDDGRSPAGFWVAGENCEVMYVGIVAQRGNDRAADLAARLCETLRAEDVSIWVDETTAERIDAPGVDVNRMTECNLVVSIGGDGTFLFAARGAGSTPILGVNLGEVGFLNAVTPDEAVEEVRSEVATYRKTGAKIGRAHV